MMQFLRQFLFNECLRGDLFDEVRPKFGNRNKALLLNYTVRIRCLITLNFQMDKLS